MFLQSCSDEELNYGMKHRFIKESDVLRTSLERELTINKTEKVIRLLKGLRRIGFLNKLRVTAKRMQKIRGLYQQYPSPKEFNEWRAKVKTIFRS